MITRFSSLHFGTLNRPVAVTHHAMPSQDSVLFGLSRGSALRTSLAASLLLAAGCSTMPDEKRVEGERLSVHDQHSKGDLKPKQPKPPPETASTAPGITETPNPGLSDYPSDDGVNPFETESPATISPSPTQSPSPSEVPEASEAPEPEPSSEPGETTEQPSIEHVNLLSQNLWAIYVKPAARENWQGRAATVADMIRDLNIDIMAAQEGTGPQIRRLKKLLGSEFKTFPGRYTTKEKLGEHTIFYKARDNGKPAWQAKQGGILSIPDTDDRRGGPFTRSQPWVRLVHAQTGQEIVLTSVHAVAHDKMWDSGGALKREKAGEILAQWAHDMKQRFPDAVVVVAGDINQLDALRAKDHALHGNRQRSIPCIVGKELRAIDDIAANRRGQCPQSNVGIDQIFTNADDVDNIRHIRRGQSDHPGLKARLKLFAAKLNIKIGEG